MAVLFSPWGNMQFVDANGNPLVGGKIMTYTATSSTPLATYTDASGTVAQTNPIILNSRGAPTLGEIWLTSGLLYKFQLFDAANNLIDTVDNVSGVSGVTTTNDEWVDSGVSPVYVSASVYTAIGDQTTQLHQGRRQKFQTTAGTVYGTILTSVFTTLTTVTMQMDGNQVLDSGLSAVQNSILRNNVWSLPKRISNTSGTDTYTANVGTARYVVGDEYKINFVNQNGTTAPTLNLDGLGAKPLVSQTGALLNARQLAGQQTVYYNGTNMVVMSPVYPAMVKERNSMQTGANTITAIGTGLNVNLLATTTPIRIAFAGGFTALGQVDYLATLAADVTSFWATQTANVINYNYFDLNITTGAVTGITSILPLISQDSTAAVSVANGQHTYVYDVGLMYVGNGSAANQVYRVPAAQNLAGATTITSVSQYGKRNKQVISGISIALGSGNVLTHGFGRSVQVYTELINVTAEGGFTTGQIMPWVNQGGYDSATVRGVTFNPSSIDVGYRISTNAWMANSYSAGTNFLVTAANWTMRLTLTPQAS